MADSVCWSRHRGTSFSKVSRSSTLPHMRSCAAPRSLDLCPVHATPPQLQSGRLGELDLDSLLPGLVLASFSISVPASEIPTRASALADPEVVDGSEASFVHSLDPAIPGCIMSCFLRLLVNF